MRIVNGKLLEVEGFMRVCDIDSGECFQFLDDETLYMRAGDFYIDVADGDVFENAYDCDRPVKEVQTEIRILK